MIKHKGLRTNRLSREPHEQIFATLWQEHHKNTSGFNLLDWLLAEDPNYPKGEVTQRDATVAATIIQWLGSSVGGAFLREAQDRIDKLDK